LHSIGQKQLYFFAKKLRLFAVKKISAPFKVKIKPCESASGGDVTHNLIRVSGSGTKASLSLGGKNDPALFTVIHRFSYFW
jgi:hypothetical protein